MPSVIDLPFAKLESEVVAWSEAAFSEAQAEANQNPTHKMRSRILQYLNGSQWPARPTAYGSSRPVINRMLRQYWELVSMLTSGKPEPQIKIFDTHDGFSELQSILTQLLISWASTPEYHEVLQDITGNGLCAYAVAKIQWNRTLAGGMGDVEMVKVAPENFYKLGGSGTLETAECVIEEEVVTIAALRRQYGRLADLVEPDASQGIASIQTMKPSQMTSSEWSKIAPHMRQVLGKRQGGAPERLFPSVRKRLFWLLDPAINETREPIVIAPGKRWGYVVKPGDPLFPRGRLIVTAGKRVMDDTCNPYYHARTPYVEYAPLRAPWLPDGMSLMSSLMGPQDIINRIVAGLLETIKANLIPTLIAPTHSISRADMDNLSTTTSGGKIEFNPNRGPAPTFRKPPDVPSLSLQMLQVIKHEMDQTSGSAAIDQAAQKDQIPSHDTMELIQNSRSSLVRVMGRSLENFMSRAGQLVIANMLQFYSVGHRVAILGEKGITPMDFSPIYGSLVNSVMAPEEFIRKFQFSIRPGSGMAFEKETRVQMAIMLNRMGVLSRTNLLRALNDAMGGVNIDLAENERELAQEALQKLAIAALGSMAAGAGKSAEKHGGAHAAA